LITGAAYGYLRAWPLQTLSARTIETHPASAQFLQAQPQAHLYRAYTLFAGAAKYELLDTPFTGSVTRADQEAFMRDLMSVNSNMRYGIQSIDGYDNFMSRRTANVLNAVMSETMKTGDVLARSKRTRAEKIQLFLDRLNVIGMMNVRHVLSAYPLMDPRLHEVWHGETTSHRIPFWIYEYPEVLPRAYLAKKVTTLLEDEQAVLSEVLQSNRDFREETLLECASCDISAAPLTSTETVSITSYAPGDVQVRVESIARRLLVFSEDRLRGWRVTMDGKPVSTYYANYLYQGVIVPAGAHDMHFYYDGP
jgi:hypothetical protein